MSIEAYQIAQGTSARDLTTQVNAGIASGLQPFGNAKADFEGGRYLQPLVRYSAPAPTGGVVVNNGDSVAQTDALGASLPASTAVVSDASLSIKLDAAIAAVQTGLNTYAKNAAHTTNAAATAQVTGSQLESVVLDDHYAIIQNGLDLDVVNAAGDLQVQGAATVDGGELTAITLGGGVALVPDGQARAVTVTGAYTTSVKFTVSGGVITGITLS